MTILEEAKAHLATYGAQHVECCGTPLIRKLVAELERLNGGPKTCTEYLPHHVESNDPTRTCLKCGLAGDQLQLSCNR